MFNRKNFDIVSVLLLLALICLWAFIWAPIKITSRPKWDFNLVVRVCEKSEEVAVLDSTLSSMATVKLPDHNLDPMVFWDFDKDYKKAERFNKKYRHEYKEGITQIRRIVKEGSGSWDGKKGLCYDIVVTPGYKYIEVSKVMINEWGFDGTNEWFIRWSGK